MNPPDLLALARRITNPRVVAEPDIEPNVFVGVVRSLTLGFDRSGT